jgi:hypothetical protein
MLRRTFSGSLSKSTSRKLGRTPCAGRESLPIWAFRRYSWRMEPWLIALILKPFAALVLFGLICLPIRIAVRRWLPEGRLKRILLRPISR